MASVHRLTHSCLTVTTANGTVLFDPDFHTFESGAIDLDTIGDVQQVLITHEHRDHLHPEFIRWLIDRGADVTVHSNQSVVDVLAGHDIEASSNDPVGVTHEDVTHERLPNGSAPPNRSYTVGGLTHSGDSFEPTTCGQVLALPVMAPWGSATRAVEFARRVAPQQVIPVHDFYMTAQGRGFITGLVTPVLEESGIEMVSLDWDESYTF